MEDQIISGVEGLSKYVNVTASSKADRIKSMRVGTFPDSYEIAFAQFELDNGVDKVIALAERATQEYRECELIDSETDLTEYANDIEAFEA